MSENDAVVTPKLKSLLTYLARVRDAIFFRTAYFKNPDLKNPREFVDASSFIYGIFSTVTIVITIIYFWFPERRLEFYSIIPLDFLIIVGLATFILLSVFRVYDLSFREFFVCFAYVMGTCAAIWAMGRLAREGISLYQNESVAACKEREVSSGLCTTATAGQGSSSLLEQVQHYLTVGEFWIPFYFSGVLAFVLAARAPTRKVTIGIAVLVSLLLFFFFYRGGGADQAAEAWLRYNQCTSDPKFADYSAVECETMTKSHWHAVRFHASLNRALALAELGKQTESADTFRLAVALDPRFTFNPQLVSRLTELGVRFAFDGHAQEARVYLDELVNRSPSDAAIRVERGRALAVWGKYGEAIADFTAAINVKPNDAVAFALRGYSRAAIYSPAAKDEKNGLTDLDEAVRLEPYNDTFLRLRGSAKSLLGDTPGAIEDIKAAIELSPNTARHYYFMGEAYRTSNQLMQAIEYYRKALEFDKDYLDAHRQLAAIYAFLVKSDAKMRAEAETHYLAAIKLKQDDEDLLLDYGSLYAREEGGCVRAVEIYDRVLKLNANSAEAFNNKGDCALAGWDYRTAVELYSEALRLSAPQSPDQQKSPYVNRRGAYYKARAVAYQELQLYDLSASDFSQAIEFEAQAGQESADTFNARAVVYLMKRDYDRAEADFAKALALSPAYVQSLIYRATLYQQKGEYAKAVDDLTAALKLAPDAPVPLVVRCALRAALARRKGDAGPMDEILADCDKAVKTADASAKDDPALATNVHFYHGMALWNAGKSAEANLAHEKALEMSRLHTEAVRTLEQRLRHTTGPATARALGSVSFYALFARRPQDALVAAEQAVELDPSLLWAKTNRAHAHMMLGYADPNRKDEAEITGARLVYLERKGETIADGLWETIIVEDFRQFRDHGLEELSLMSEVESAFATR